MKANRPHRAAVNGSKVYGSIYYQVCSTMCCVHFSDDVHSETLARHTSPRYIAATGALHRVTPLPIELGVRPRLLGNCQSINGG